MSQSCYLNKLQGSEITAFDCLGFTVCKAFPQFSYSVERRTLDTHEVIKQQRVLFLQTLSLSHDGH